MPHSDNFGRRGIVFEYKERMANRITIYIFHNCSFNHTDQHMIHHL